MSHHCSSSYPTMLLNLFHKKTAGKVEQFLIKTMFSHETQTIKKFFSLNKYQHGNMDNFRILRRPTAFIYSLSCVRKPRLKKLLNFIAVSAPKII